LRLPTLSWIATLLVGLALGSPLPGTYGAANAAPAKSASASSARPRQKQAQGGKRDKKSKRDKRARAERSRKTKVCKRQNGKRKCRWQARFDGHAVAEAKLREEPLPKPSGDIWLYSINFREEVHVNIYDENGEMDPDVMAQLDHLFRCRRTGEERAVDPRLYEILSTIYDQYGQQRIELVSGFRNQPNEGSRHYHASAMDIRIPGVPVKELYEFATGLDAGGMGIGKYPTSGFIHVDWRAPGEKSYRWTDYSGPDDDEGKKPRRRKRRQPNS
jgi:uncharacterized protein YcbK (DUF882 family)